MKSKTSRSSKKKAQQVQIDLSCGMERHVPVSAPKSALSLITDKIFEYTDVLCVAPDAAPLLRKAKGCSCENCDKENCSCMKAGKKNKPKYVKYCSEKCGCKRNCGNYLEGVAADKFILSVKLEVVRINPVKGWGVRALETIDANRIFLEYTGVLTLNNPDVDDIYIFNANLGPHSFVIDAFRRGNVARFINHSCEPNLISLSAVFGVEKNIPHVLIKALRRIKVGEELTVDYGDDFWNANVHPIQVCRCRSKTCKYSDPNRSLKADENKGVRRISSSIPKVQIYKCDHCPYAGNNRNGLKMHLGCHTTDYPFKCKKCSFSCRSNSHLSKHSAVHLQKKQSVIMKKKSVIKKKK